MFSLGDLQDRNRSKAITAGVVGGILFFIAAIVLSVCAVKICNKRKRRKAEKGNLSLFFIIITEWYSNNITRGNMC